MKKIKIDNLRSKLENNDIKLVEVLGKDEFKEEHIKEAINIPLRKIATKANQKFEKDEPIAVYCSDRDCTASPTAGKKLEDMGFGEVYHYPGGKKEWKEAGYPTEQGI